MKTKEQREADIAEAKEKWAAIPKAGKIFFLTALVFFAAMITFVVIDGDSDPKPKIETDNGENYLVRAYVQKYLQQNLNDYSSYESMEWSKALPADSTKTSYVIRHKYRAANGFGAKILQDKFFQVNANGQVTGVVDAN